MLRIYTAIRHVTFMASKWTAPVIQRYTIQLDNEKDPAPGSKGKRRQNQLLYHRKYILFSDIKRKLCATDSVPGFIVHNTRGEQSEWPTDRNCGEKNVLFTFIRLKKFKILFQTFAVF